MFRAIGLSDEQMIAWHREFENQNPQGHQEFLKWIAIGQDEIAKIRAL